jgi:hypothetical protein
MLVVLIVELFDGLSKMYPSLKPKSLIKHVKLFLPYYKAWIRQFHQNRVVLTDVPVKNIVSNSFLNTKR